MSEINPGAIIGNVRGLISEKLDKRIGRLRNEADQAKNLALVYLGGSALDLCLAIYNVAEDNDSLANGLLVGGLITGVASSAYFNKYNNKTEAADTLELVKAVHLLNSPAINLLESKDTI